MPETDVPVIEARHLRKEFSISSDNSLFARKMTAVEDVSFRVYPGETFGLVGESGCGKSTIAKLLMGLEKPTDGEIYFKGQRIDRLGEHRLQALRPHYQMVFQDSGSSLNPRKRVREILRDPMVFHHTIPAKQADRRVEELLQMVGLRPEMAGRYPHEFSGGQRQRICIARALSLNPDLIVLDEPVSALDVSVQAQILNLLRDLQEQMRLTYIFIGHGLGAVHYISQRIAVMYMGRIVETGSSEEIFSAPVHPYTKALVDASPAAVYEQRGRERVLLTGEVGSFGWKKEDGCALYGRCPYADESCRTADPELREIAPGHFSACTRAAGKSGGADGQ